MNGKRLINDLQIAIVVYQDIFYVTRCMDNECDPNPNPVAYVLGEP